MKKTAYEVVYDTEHFSGSFVLYDYHAAISTAIDILGEWMMNERNDWVKLRDLARKDNRSRLWLR